MSVEPESATEVVELTIRCALQTFDDKSIKASIDWKVEQLKQHLFEVCATKPDPKRQRLIYAGHCLKDHQTLREILNKRCEGLEEVEDRGPQVIHLVCAPKQAPQMPAELRRRQNATTTNNTNNAAGQQTNSNFMNFNPQNNYFTGMSSNIIPQNITPEQLAYYANWMGYQQALMMNMYYQQMIGTSSVLPGYNFQMNHQNMQQMQNQANGDQNNNNVQQQGQNANEEEHLNDIVSILYKSIRVGFILMLLFLYSSIERFLAVFLIMFVLWFLHRRRGQNQLNDIARVNNNNQQQQQNEEDRPQVNNDNNNNEIPAPVIQQPEAPTRWNVLCSTVSTFFLSLIPEHNHVPVDVAE